MKLTDAIRKMRPSIVQINVPDGEHTRPIGTGFIVDEAHHRVVTALHVVLDEEPGDLKIGFALPDAEADGLGVRAGFMSAPATIIDTSPADDLVLLGAPDGIEIPNSIEINEHVFEGDRRVPITIQPDQLREGTSLAVSGYPLGEPALVTNAGVLASTWALREKDPDSSLGKLAPEPQDTLLGDFTANPGNSGGPVYLAEKGAVVGICLAGRLTRIVGGEGLHHAGLSVFGGAASIVTFLERNGIKGRIADQARPRQQARKARR